MSERDLLLRKHQRQKKIDPFAKEARGHPALRLAEARMRGAAALAALAADLRLDDETRALAVWSQGELRSGLMAMRRHPAWQDIAEGWLLLLKGDHQRALERFGQAAATQPRRAAAGATVALAALGRIAEAGARWAGIGPIPAAVFPAAGDLSRLLTHHAAGWDGIRLRQLLSDGTPAEIAAALRDYPSDRVSERAHLALRLGDLSTDPASPRNPVQLWRQAEQDPALRPDALKRRFWHEMRHGDEMVTTLGDLYDVLLRSDPAEARRCVEVVIGILDERTLSRVVNPFVDPRTALLHDGAPIEWVLVWFRHWAPVMEQVADMGDLAIAMSGGALPPSTLKEWRPWLRLLDAAYAHDIPYLDAKFKLLKHFRQYGEVRLACHQRLIAQPERRDEFLLSWCDAARRDKRSLKSIRAELAALDGLFPGSMDLMFAFVEFNDAGPDVQQERIRALPPLRAKVWHWMCQKGPPPSASDYGQDAEADAMTLRHLSLDPRGRELFAQLLTGAAEPLHAALSKLRQQGFIDSALWVAALWASTAPANWRGWFHCGLIHKHRNAVRRARRELLMAAQLMPVDAPERPDIERTLAELESDAGDSSRDDEDEDEDEEDDARGFGFGRRRRRTRWSPVDQGSRTSAPVAAPGPLITATRTAGLQDALVLAGIDHIFKRLDDGMPVAGLSADERARCSTFLNMLRSFVTSGEHGDTVTTWLKELA